MLLLSPICTPQSGLHPGWSRCRCHHSITLQRNRRRQIELSDCTSAPFCGMMLVEVWRLRLFPSTPADIALC
jgi:hypothetical protein